MILRLSDRLGKKIKCRPSSVLPLAKNPYADWTARLFIMRRTQYVMLSNTVSLYTVVTYGRGIADELSLLERANRCIGEFLCEQGYEFLFRRFVAAEMAEVFFSKGLSRQVTGSMNELEFQAKVLLEGRSFSPHELSVELNEVFLSVLSYDRPRDAFLKLAGGRDA